MKKTDEEIVNDTVGQLFWTSKHPKDMFVKQSVIQAYRKGEQSLQAEIEKWKKETFEQSDEKARLQSELDTARKEIEELKEKLRQHEGMSEQLSKVIYENADLRQKHSALVEGLKGLPVYGAVMVFGGDEKSKLTNAVKESDIEQLINKGE